MRDLGDFQTPPDLVRRILEFLGPIGLQWPRVLEPTAGRGNFVAGLLASPSPPKEIRAIEMQGSYLQPLRELTSRADSTRVGIMHADIFGLDLGADVHWDDHGPLLVLGNPPWVTNAELGAIGSKNLPKKTNLKGFQGLDALTGKSNFDIAEFILLKIIRELKGESPTLVMLSKTAVLRNVLQFCNDQGIAVRAEVRRIDAKKWFDAAVDACVFRLDVGLRGRSEEIPVYATLDQATPDVLMGFGNRRLVADILAYRRAAFVEGKCSLAWRQGIKHDAAAVMELQHDNRGQLCNRAGENVDVEKEYVFPLLKSSDLHKGTPIHRSVIVTQRKVRADTRRLQAEAPKLWAYLSRHASEFERRKSSIYKGLPPFSIFGVGPYSFSPYKVAISGLHKEPRFRLVVPQEGRPVMLDDTCYFLPAYSAVQAALLHALLNDSKTKDLVEALTFWDAKRPITKDVLQRIDLVSVLRHTERQSLLQHIHGELGPLEGATRLDWPPLLEELLVPEVAA